MAAAKTTDDVPRDEARKPDGSNVGRDDAKIADAKGDPTVAARERRAEDAARTSRSTASHDAATYGRTRTSTSPDAKDTADEPASAPNIGDVRDNDDPIEVEGEVIDNAYAELKINGKKHKFWPDDMHRLRKLLDRVMIELPR